MTTLAERWKAEGLARRHAMAARKLLRWQLELKFGALSDEHAAHFDAASDPDIEEWALRVRGTSQSGACRTAAPSRVPPARAASRRLSL